MAPTKKIVATPAKKIALKVKVKKEPPAPLACMMIVGTRGTPPTQKKRTPTDDYLDPPGFNEPAIKICCAGKNCKRPVYPMDQKFMDECERCDGLFHMMCCGSEHPYPEDEDYPESICLKCLMEVKVLAAEDKKARYEANPWLMQTPTVSTITEEQLTEFRTGKWRYEEDSCDSV
jgi:hypothetical protein